MADANARKEAIKQASQQVRTGSAFVRRADAPRIIATVKPTPSTQKK